MKRLRDFTAGVELIVLAALGEEFVVGASLDDAAFFQHDDTVAVTHGGEAMGDDKGRATLHQ